MLTCIHTLYIHMICLYAYLQICVPLYEVLNTSVVFFPFFFLSLPTSHFIQDDTLLVIGWGTSVKIASIRSNQNGATNGTYRHVPMSSMNKVDIVASFQTSYFISGVAPFGDSLVVLAYIPGEEDGEKEFSSTIPSRQVLSPLPFWEIHWYLIPDHVPCRLEVQAAKT